MEKCMIEVADVVYKIRCKDSNRIQKRRKYTVQHTPALTMKTASGLVDSFVGPKSTSCVSFSNEASRS